MADGRPVRAPTRFRLGIAVCGVLLASALVGPVQAADAEPRVVVLRRNLPPFQQAGQGVTAAMRGAGLRPKVREVLLEGKDAEVERALASARKYDPVVVVAIGSDATRLSKRVFPGTPIVFAVVLNPVRTGILESPNAPSGNVTGATIDIPFALQFRKYKAVVPNARRLGVLSNPAQTGPLIAAAREAAAAEGLTLEVSFVSDAREVPAALERLMRTGIDGLWTVADPTVLNPSTTTIILKESLRARLPTMGLTRQHCKAGFLFALAVDYNANGRQAGELATRVVQGASPAQIAVAVPEDVQLILNARIAKHIGHDFTPEVLESAAYVFK